MFNKEDLNAEVQRIGFFSCGITLPTRPSHFSFFESWLDLGFHAGMDYLDRDRSKFLRSNPAALMEGCLSILVLAASYPEKPISSDLFIGNIASYVHTLDYHVFLSQKLKDLVSEIEKMVSVPFHFRAFTDSAPVLERDLAWRAGLGWIGKNSCLITPKAGSFTLLAELFLDFEIEPDQPITHLNCGSCTRCIQACPTACINPDRSIDSNRCIAYHTIENKGIIPIQLRPLMGNMIFGCDICQHVCPWNKPKMINGSTKHALNLSPIQNPVLLDEVSLTQQDFKNKFQQTAVSRVKRRGYLRNVCIALGNSGNEEALPSLISLLFNEGEPLIRAHAAWAVGNIKGLQNAGVLKKALAQEMDPLVINEIRLALDSHN